MTKDEELKDAREWWIREQNLLYDLNKEQVEFVSGKAAKLLLAYHHHRLDTAEPVKTAECDSCGTKHRIDSMTVLCEKCFVETNEI